MQHIADRIQTESKARGVTVAGLALATSIPRVTLIRRLANPAALTLDELNRIAAALELDPIDLVTPKAA